MFEVSRSFMFKLRCDSSFQCFMCVVIPQVRSYHDMELVGMFGWGPEGLGCVSDLISDHFSSCCYC